MKLAQSYSEIIEKIQCIDPIGYGKTRNFENGKVTELSPYISRGIISTKTVVNSLRSRGFSISQMLPLLQQLAWRDYFQRVGQHRPNLDREPLRSEQDPIAHHQLPMAILEAKTGIKAIDRGILKLLDEGMMHNHVRMYVASITTNLARAHWSLPARWMYFHLLDADFASNFISWQWVAGASRDRKYIANQENINHFCKTTDRNTFLDVEMESFPWKNIPTVLQPKAVISLKTTPVETEAISINPHLPTCLYTPYNLDPHWRQDKEYNRILVLDPVFFERFPMADHTLDFVVSWAQKIPGMQIFWGSWDDLVNYCRGQKIYQKEHPHLKFWGAEGDERDWIFPEIDGFFPSFFGYWKRAEKVISKW